MPNHHKAAHQTVNYTTAQGRVIPEGESVHFFQKLYSVEHESCIAQKTPRSTSEHGRHKYLVKITGIILTRLLIIIEPHSHSLSTLTLPLLFYIFNLALHVPFHT